MARNLTTGLQRGLRRSLRPGLGGGDLFTTASLDLNFARYKTLDPRITFTRASSGTYVDSQGVIRTATTNLLLRSEEFGTTWGTLNSSVSADATIAPNGTSTADKIIEHSTTSVHGVNRTLAPESLVNGIVYTFSVYAKAAERGFIWMQALDSFAKSYFNLSTGVISSSGSGHTSTITAVGNGWYRCAITFTSDQTNNSYRAIGIAQTSGTESYAGDGSSGLFLWGAQLEQSSTVGEYIPTTSTINSAPRFNHNPTTGESLGLLVEEQRTNLVLQSENFDGWAKGLATVTTDSINSPVGTQTADLITLSAGTGQKGVNTSGTTTGAVTYSVFLKAGTHSIIQLLQGGSANNYANFNISTGVVGNTGTGTTASITSFGNGWYRCSMSHANNVSGIYVNAASSLTDGFFPSVTVTGTFYAWGAQLEAGAFPTSYIPTTTAAATRSADVASISGSNFSSWYRQDEGSFYAETVAAPGVTAASQGIFGLDDGTTSSNYFAGRPTGRGFRLISRVSGSIDADMVVGIQNDSIFAKTAYGIKTNDYALFASTGASGFDTSVLPPPGMINMKIGSHIFSGTWGGTIRRLTYWPQRLSNATLQAVTQ